MNQTKYAYFLTRSYLSFLSPVLKWSPQSDAVAPGLSPAWLQPLQADKECNLVKTNNKYEEGAENANDKSSLLLAATTSKLLKYGIYLMYAMKFVVTKCERM